MRGIVLNFLKRKGYGFIRAEDGKKFFVHFSDIRGNEYRTLIEGEEVEFIVRKGERGLHAEDVVRLNPPQTNDDLVTPKRTW